MILIRKIISVFTNFKQSIFHTSPNIFPYDILISSFCSFNSKLQQEIHIIVACDGDDVRNSQQYIHLHKYFIRVCLSTLPLKNVVLSSKTNKAFLLPMESIRLEEAIMFRALIDHFLIQQGCKKTIAAGKNAFNKITSIVRRNFLPLHT